MKTQRFRLKSTGQFVYMLKSAGKYAEVLLPYDHVTRKGMRGNIMTVKTENLIEENSGGYSYG